MTARHMFPWPLLVLYGVWLQVLLVLPWCVAQHMCSVIGGTLYHVPVVTTTQSVVLDQCAACVLQPMTGFFAVVVTIQWIVCKLCVACCQQCCVISEASPVPTIFWGSYEDPAHHPHTTLARTRHPCFSLPRQLSDRAAGGITVGAPCPSMWHAACLIRLARLKRQT